MKVIDMHAHIYPDKVAAKASVAITDYFALSAPPCHYGSVGELVAVMERAGLDYAMVCSAATTPHQVESINRFIAAQCRENPAFIPCGTLHADYENYRAELAWLRENGIHGVKIVCEFQHFALDDERLFPMFEEMEKHDMFLFAHMGDPRVNLSGPHRMLPVATTFPKLRCIAAHLGNWDDWDIGKIRPLAGLSNVYTDISSSFGYVATAQEREHLKAVMDEYDPTHVFFGSDYPVWCPEKEVARAVALGFDRERLEDILFNNFARFYHYREL